MLGIYTHTCNVNCAVFVVVRYICSGGLGIRRFGQGAPAGSTACGPLMLFLDQHLLHAEHGVPSRRSCHDGIHSKVSMLIMHCPPQTDRLK